MKLNIMNDLKKKLNKKTIWIISGVCVTIIGLSLVVGLGVVLQSNSDPIKTKNPNSSTTPPKDMPSTYKWNNYSFSESELETGEVEIEGENYNVVKEANKFYLNLPANSNLYLIAPTINVPSMLAIHGPVYDERTKNEWGKGKDGYYQIDFMAIGAIKIINGIVYGGYQEIKDNQNNITGYNLDSLIDSNQYPNGYPIGSFDANGGGINMLKLQKLKYIIDGNPATTENNAETTTRFTFFPLVVSSNPPKTVITMALSRNTSNLPKNIGFVSNEASDYVFTSFPASAWPTFSTAVSLYEDDGITIKPRFRPINFVIDYFTLRDGRNRAITLQVTDSINAIKTVNLNDLYMPVTYKVPFYQHKLLGKIEQSFDGKIHLPSTFILNEGISNEITVTNLQFNLPEIKLLFEKET